MKENTMAIPLTIKEMGSIMWEKYYKKNWEKLQMKNEKYYDDCTCDELEWAEEICPFCAYLDEIDEQPDDDCGCEPYEDDCPEGCQDDYCDCVGDDGCESCCVM
jgi:hypothetical protein